MSRRKTRWMIFTSTSTATRSRKCASAIPGVSCAMRYLVKARVKHGRKGALLKAIADGSLGRGSVAGDEYLHNMQEARVAPNGTAHWVETCFCATPLAE